ncbi:MAG: class A beta-lactamase-related serine hydrolase [Pedobacter sp.]|nr:MAG: class A beta-lactamase-related serine hydrolase [Pedobacter sp.]
MKKLLLLFLIAAVAISAYARQDASKKAVDEFVSLFNEKKFSEIYVNFAPSFKLQVPEAAGVGLMSQVFTGVGRLESSSFVSETNGRFNYLLKGTQANISLQFDLTEGKLDKVRISPATAPQNVNQPVIAPLKNDNPLVSGIDKAIEAGLGNLQKSRRLVGMAVGVLEAGKTTYYGYGETVKGNGIIPANNSIFDIGSISKTFTAYLLASLVIESKLDLNSRLDKYFRGLDPRVGAITVKQLANHTSGLPNMGAIPINGITGRDPNEQYTALDLENGLKNVQLNSEPGVSFGYSNLGYATLGYIIEKAGKQTYTQMLEKYILKPYGMHNTFYRIPVKLAASLRGYDENGSEKDYLSLQAYGPAGNIKSTTEDILKYAQLIMSDDKAASLTRQITFTPEKGNKVGLSWIVIPMNNKEFIFHNGATIGYRSYLAIHPDTKKALVILNNSANDVTPVGMQLMGFFLSN